MNDDSDIRFLGLKTSTIFILILCGWLLSLFIARTLAVGIDKAIDPANIFIGVFSVLSSLFTGLAFFGLAVSIGFQRKALEKSENAQEAQAKQFQSQIDAVNKQAFEQVFFGMIDRHFKLIEQLDRAQDKKNNVVKEGDVIETYVYLLEGNTAEKNIVLSSWTGYDLITPYFRSIYSILSYVDSCKMIDLKDKNSYACFLKSNMSHEQVKLLLYAILIEGLENEAIKVMVEKYALLENLHFFTPMDIDQGPNHEVILKVLELYDQNAFGNNFNRIKNRLKEIESQINLRKI